MPTLKTGTVQAPLPWKLDRLCEDFRNSFVQLVSRLGLEPRSLSTPDFKSVIKVAVRELIPRHNLQIGLVRLPIPPTTHIFRNLKSFADLRHTLCLTFTYIQPVGRHGLSFEERPLTSGPSLSTKSHAGMTTCNFHPPFRNI